MVPPSRFVPPTLACVALLLAAAPGAQAAPPACPSAGPILVAPGAQVTFPANPCTDPEGDPYVVEVLSAPTKGELTANAYTAFDDAHGYDEFTYRAVDDNGEASEEATVVMLVDQVPVCQDAVAATTIGTALVLPEFPCEDADGDTLTILIGDPQFGTVDISADGTTVIYTPPPGFSGTDVLQFAAEEDDFLLAPDVHVMSAVHTLRITVAAAPPPPPPPPPPPAAPSGSPAKSADLTAPGVTLRSLARRLKPVLRNGLPLRLAVTEDATASVTLRVSRATARALGLKRKPRRAVRVGRAAAALRAGESTVVVDLTAKARRAMRTARRVKLLVTVVVRDTAGNRTTRTRTVTLKR